MNAQVGQQIEPTGGIEAEIFIGQQPRVEGSTGGKEGVDQDT